MANAREITNRMRRNIVRMIYEAKYGHPGGSLSIVEILYTLYFEIMDKDVNNFGKKDEDKFILSKGHAAPGLYAVLCEKGYIKEEELWTLRKTNSELQGHPDCKHTKGVDVNTGSLGQGTSMAVGMALAKKFKKDNHKVYALLGDGELQEGLVWEASMAAGHYKLDNLTFIIDNNGLQIDGANDDVMTVKPIDKKFEAFNFEVINVDDGNDIEKLKTAFNAPHNGKPKAIICKTVKGKGVSFMENVAGWHGKAPNDEEYKIAMSELGGV